MKLYIAGPMTGIENFNFPAFKRAVSLLHNHGYEVESPHVNGEGNKELPYEYYIRAGLKQLIECDGIALLDGWEGSRGARFEVYVGRFMKIPCDPISVWLDKPKHRRHDEGT